MNSYSIEYSDSFYIDFEEIIDYVEYYFGHRGVRNLADLIVQKVEQASQFPESFPRVEGTDFRKISISSGIIYFKLFNEKLVVTRFVDGRKHQKKKSWKNQKQPTPQQALIKKKAIAPWS